MNEIDLIMLICATWYISYCLVSLPGPLGIFGILRARAGLLKCVYCMSLWIGIVLYAFVYVGRRWTLVGKFRGNELYPSAL
jgi:ABC-type tungstate transport system substrate-binding protein